VAIEWGGDIHCPHGDVATAKNLRRRCEDAGISTPSYGSYYRMNPECAEPDFRCVLDSAIALGAETIRVWAGGMSSRDMDSGYRNRLIEEIRRIASIAALARCSIGLEYHRNTATDTNTAALDLLKEIDHPAVKTYWQPREATLVEERLAGLRMILPWLCHLHVFHWVGTPVERRPLAESKEDWMTYFRTIGNIGIPDRCAFLEFVPNDSFEALCEEARALIRILM
jgi:sugar phosphate isomerase/epimerase